MLCSMAMPSQIRRKVIVKKRAEPGRSSELEFDMQIRRSRFAAYAACVSMLPISFGAAGAETVVVKPGDTLSQIAERELGSMERVVEICRINRKVLRYDCDYLTVGTVLTLPAQSGAPRADASAIVPVGEEIDRRDTLSGDFVARLSRARKHSLRVPAGYFARRRDGFALLAGYVANASAWGAPGISLQLPDSFEKSASGRTVKVEALLRLAPETVAGSGTIALVYSTADVGNSGWQIFDVGTQFTTVSFTYPVARMKQGNNDFIGILPDPKNTGQRLHVAEIAVSVVAE